MTNQIRRVAVSVPSNIAEGHARTNREFGHFLRIVRGSLAEPETQLELATRIGFLPNAQFDEVSAELSVLAKQLNVLQQRVDSSPSHYQQPTTSNRKDQR